MSTEGGRLGRFSTIRLGDRLVDEFLGICRGVLMDGELHDKEVVRLHSWCAEHMAQLGQWPLDVIADRVIRTLEDGVIEDEERADLLHLLTETVGGKPEDASGSSSLPLTIPPPRVVFREREFCFTGTFAFGTRKACEEAVAERGGRCRGGVSSSLSYLVIGARATKAWVHSSYGRKIEEAVELARNGASPTIISEEHWVRAIETTTAEGQAQYRARVIDTISEAIRLQTSVSFLYRGSPRVISPFGLTTSYGQMAVEGMYLDGASPDPKREVRQYLIAHITDISV